MICAKNYKTNFKFVTFTGGGGVVVNALVVINEVTLRWARLVLGWVAVCEWINHLGV